MARIIEINVVLEIFSFKKKYPKIARNNVWVCIIKFAFATVVLYIANTYPENPNDKIKPPNNVPIGTIRACRETLIYDFSFFRPRTSNDRARRNL